MGWWLGALGKIAEKATEWLPSKKESYRDRIDKIKREMNDLQKAHYDKPWTTRDADRYTRLSHELSSIQSKVKNLD